MNSSPALAASGMAVRYGHGPMTVNDIDLHIEPGEVVALLGVNGAGKSTTLMALAGALKSAAGSTSLYGAPNAEPVYRRVRRGLGLVTEERCVFSSLTVRDNLRIGRGDMQLALDLFPELVPHLNRPAGLLSGGQQQMLALGRVLAARPKVLLADELSLGLAPIVVRRLLDAVRAAADDGIAVLLVEQHIRLALGIADRAYVMRRGRIVHEAGAAELRDDPDRVAELYIEGSAQ